MCGSRHASHPRFRLGVVRGDDLDRPAKDRSRRRTAGCCDRSNAAVQAAILDDRSPDSHRLSLCG